MKKYFILSTALILLLAALSFREWLLLQEIAVTKSQLKDQASSSIQSAQSLDRVHYFTTSAVVYERYLSPVIDVANRLMWPPSRTEIIAEWKREIHATLDDLTANRRTSLSQDANLGIQKLRGDSKPGLNRLYEVLKLSENNTDLSCAQTVREEMKSISDAGQKRDQEILTQMKVEGLTQLKHLDKAVKGMSPAQIGNFLRSGRFLREIQQPVLDYVLQIKQEELRKAAWSEFERKLSVALAKKSVPVAAVKDRNLRAKKEIEKLFNSMAEAKTEEHLSPSAPSKILAPRVPELPNIESPSAEPRISLEDLSATEMSSPSDATSP